jgi:hypothetical protein
MIRIHNLNDGNFTLQIKNNFINLHISELEDINKELGELIKDYHLSQEDNSFDFEPCFGDQCNFTIEE